MKRFPLFTAALTLAHALFAQWTVPDRIELTGADTVDRQVTGLGMPVQAGAGISAGAARTLYTNFVVAQGVDTLTVSTTPPISAYFQGLMLVVRPAAGNNGPVMLRVDALPLVPVRKHVDQPLDSMDLRAGIPVTMVYDGSVFQVTSQMEPSCPKGTVALSRDACIDVASRDSLFFLDANAACAGQNGRLCTFAEWIAACHRLPGFLASVSSLEWVDSASNNQGDAKSMGFDGVTPTANCKEGATTSPFLFKRYRCCFDR